MNLAMSTWYQYETTFTSYWTGSVHSRFVNHLVTHSNTGCMHGVHLFSQCADTVSYVILSGRDSSIQMLTLWSPKH